MKNYITPEFTQEIPYGYCHCGCGQKTTISNHTSNKHGRKKGEPTRYLAGHGRNPFKGTRKHKRTWIEWFWQRVDKNDPSGCWNWTGALTISGYGSIHIKGKHVTCHRFTYELEHGAIPEGLYALHKCDNRRCVNPDHIFIGTKGDNARDMVNKRRSLTGELNHKAKLTEKQVREIRKMYSSGNYSFSSIARLYNVHYSAISSIIKYKHWIYVD